jgi:nicotinamide phosphoribosyltransferase
MNTEQYTNKESFHVGPNDMRTLAPLNVDGYKVDHRRQYPSNATLVFSNLTARGSRVEGLDSVIFFGLQYFMDEYLIKDWNDNFFSLPLDAVTEQYGSDLLGYLGVNDVGDQHIRDLHALGHLPLEIWALPEGSNVNLRVPMMVVWNTDARFYWLTNAIETILSTTIWMPCTSATTALMYRRILDRFASETNPEMKDFVGWQGHDFSFRGHSSRESACTSGAGHLLSFTGTDTLPAISLLEKHYACGRKTELIGGSVAATEHSVMCMGGLEDEVGTFKRLITEVYPNGIVSIVSDTWDFWNVVNPDGGIAATLKDIILARDGKVVIRPDSGDPVKIVSGYLEDEIIRENGKIYINSESVAYINDGNGNMVLRTEDLTELTELEVKGMIVCLHEIFGGTETSTGYIQLDSHIGAIYGDSITLERAFQICDRLKSKGFASTNVVFGIGSFTYQGAITDNAIVTRDTHMFAVKSTYGEVRDEDGTVRGIEIFKDPKTDSGMKKSAKGLTAVYRDGSDFVLKDQATWDDVCNCAFVQVFKDGAVTKRWTLGEVRAEVAKNL